MTNEVAPPYISPDGRWWWDGTQWLPFPRARMSSTRKAFWWSLALIPVSTFGCIAGIVAAFLAGGFCIDACPSNALLSGWITSIGVYVAICLPMCWLMARLCAERFRWLVALLTCGSPVLSLAVPGFGLWINWFTQPLIFIALCAVFNRRPEPAPSI